MRRLSVIMLIFICLLSIQAYGQIEWQGPKRAISGNAVDFVIDPSNGNLHVVSGYKYGGLIYAVLDSVGNQISEEVLDSSAPEGNLNWGPTIALDSEGYPHIAYKYQITFPYAGTLPGWEPVYSIGYLRKTEEGWLPRISIARNVWRGYVVRMNIDSEDRVHLCISSTKESFLGQGPIGDCTYYRIIDGVIDRTQLITSLNVKQYRIDNRVELVITDDDVLHLFLGNPTIERELKHVPYYRSMDNGDSWQLAEDLFAYDPDKRGGAPDASVSGGYTVHVVFGTTRYDGRGNVRYVQYFHNSKIRSSTPAPEGHVNTGWTSPSVGATNDGSNVAVCWLDEKGYGSLYTAISQNGGVTWSQPELIHQNLVGADDDGRSVPLIRAYKNHIYMIYSSYTASYVRYIRNLGDTPPTADAGGPYAALEGETVTLDASASLDAGTNPGISSYAWDWTGDGVADTTVSTPVLELAFADDLQADLVLEVTDYAGFTARDTTTLTIQNQAPVIEINGIRTAPEGGTIQLAVAIDDPGVEDTHTIEWDLTEGQQSDTVEAEAQYVQDGERVVTVTVTDKDGAVVQDTAHVHIYNVAPVADAGGIYKTVPNESVTLTASATDIGVEDVVTGHWDLDGNGSYEVEGFSTTLSFSVTGYFAAYFEARDEDGGVGRDTAYIDVSNGAPVIASMAGQTIAENDTFADVMLDDFVSDEEHGDERLSWFLSGADELLAEITTDHILKVTVPDSEWAGQDTLRLIVSDPMGLRDSTEIVYEVTPVNDPPVWLGEFEYTVNEDDTLKLSMSLLYSVVTDPDNQTADLTFILSDHPYIYGDVNAEGDQWHFWSALNWYGADTLTWTVQDPEGAAGSIRVPITIESVADAPEPFSIIGPASIDTTAWPDSIRFVWHQAVDPDSNDRVTYILKIDSQSGGSGWAWSSPTLLDTTLLFIPPADAPFGVFFWWVEAEDFDGHESDSQQNGTIFIRDQSSVVEEEKPAQPESFELLQNHPNPFNPQTQITFHLPGSEMVSLAVYNMLGQKIRTLVQEYRNAGVHTVLWDGRDEMGNLVPTGVYLYRMDAGGHTFMRKMMLMQ